MKPADTGNSGPRERIPDGTYAGRCYQVVDLGLQEVTWEGVAKLQPKVMIGFELSELMADGKPFAVSTTLTFSWGEKAAFRKVILPWIGTKAVDTKPDPKEFLGMPALVTVETSMGKNGNEWTNIRALSPVPKGMPVPSPVNAVKHFDFETSGMADYDNLSTDWSREKGEPSWVQKKIQASAQWFTWLNNQKPKNTNPDEDIPF